MTQATLDRTTDLLAERDTIRREGHELLGQEIADAILDRNEHPRIYPNDHNEIHRYRTTFWLRSAALNAAAIRKARA